MPIDYPNHADLTHYRDAKGASHPIGTAADWLIRRQHIVDNVQRIMGPLPRPDQPLALDVKTIEEVRVGGLVRRKITYQSEIDDRVTALFEPRLKAIVSSSGFTTFRKDDLPSWTGPAYMPRIASEFGNDAARVPFDFDEIVASFAPRAFLACAAGRDEDFDVHDIIGTAASV